MWPVILFFAGLAVAVKVSQSLSQTHKLSEEENYIRNNPDMLSHFGSFLNGTFEFSEFIDRGSGKITFFHRSARISKEEYEAVRGSAKN